MQARQLLAADFAPLHNGASPLVFQTDNGRITDALNRAAINASLKRVTAIPSIASAASPFAIAAGEQLSADGSTAISPILVNSSPSELTAAQAQEVLAATQPAIDAGMTTTLAGPLGDALNSAALPRGELLAVLVAAVVLLAIFGAVATMGIALISAGLALVAGLGVVTVLTRLVAVPDLAASVGAVACLAVGLLFSVIILRAHLRNLAEDMDLARSIESATASAGRVVLFAALVLVGSGVAFGVAGVNVIGPLGFVLAGALLSASLTVVVVLPAGLAIIGQKITSLPLTRRATATTLSSRLDAPTRLSGAITAHPRIAAGLMGVLLVALAVPTVTLGVGQPGPDSRIITEKFGPGDNGPLLIASQISPAAEPAKKYSATYDSIVALQADSAAKQALANDQTFALKGQRAAVDAKLSQVEANRSDLAAQRGNLQRDQQGVVDQRDQLNEEQATNAQQQSDIRSQLSDLSDQQSALGSRRVQLGDQIANITAAIAAATTPAEKAALGVQREQAQAEVAAIGPQVDAVEASISSLTPGLIPLKQQAKVLAQRSDTLAQQEAVFAAPAGALAKLEASLQKQADVANQQAAGLRKQANATSALSEQGLAEAKKAASLQSKLARDLDIAGGDARTTDSRISAMAAALRATPGIAAVGQPQVSSLGNSFVIAAIPTTSSGEPATAALVANLRSSVIPSVVAPGVTSFVGGQTATDIDVAAALSAEVPWAVLIIVVFAFVLLLLAGRSLFLAVQGAVISLCSAAGALGAVTVLFQWSLAVPVSAVVPPMMLTLGVGMSIIFEFAFIAALVRHRDLPSTLARTAKLLVGAGLAAGGVLIGLVSSSDFTLKQLGVGLAVAVLISAPATVVSGYLVVRRFGERTWSLPNWLDRVLPQGPIEGRYEVDLRDDSAYAPDPDLVTVGLTDLVTAHTRGQQAGPQ